ncbi:Axonemal dynein light chain domain-containing protein 1, partial [Cichlidogyrus casuarinus]
MLPSVDLTHRPAGRPSNAWHFPRRRHVLRHLLTQPKCNCGAGSNLAVIFRNHDATSNVDSPLDTRILHLIKIDSCKKLTIHDSPFTTTLSPHPRHKVALPPLASNPRVFQPTSKAIVPFVHLEPKNETDRVNLKQFLELMCQEQNLFNQFGFEVIKQETIECIERGKLLSDLREAVRNTLTGICTSLRPLQDQLTSREILIRSVTAQHEHFEEMLTRIMTELASTIEHRDENIKCCSKEAHNLIYRIHEAQKSQELIKVFRLIYTCQKRRLQMTLTRQKEDRDLWHRFSLILAKSACQKHFRISQEDNSLIAISRVYSLVRDILDSVPEWEYLAIDLIAYLKNHDEAKIEFAQKIICQDWRSLAEELAQFLEQRESACEKCLLELKNLLQQMIQCDGKEKLTSRKLFESILQINQTLSVLIENFGGDVVLSIEQSVIAKMRDLQEKWTSSAIESFSLHPVKRPDRKEESLYPDHEALLTFNEALDHMLRGVQIRLIGENGSVSGLIALSEYLDSWLAKLRSFLGPDPEGVAQRAVHFEEDITESSQDNDWAPLIPQAVTLLAIVDDATSKLRLFVKPDQIEDIKSTPENLVTSFSREISNGSSLFSGPTPLFQRFKSFQPGFVPSLNLKEAPNELEAWIKKA